MKIDRVNAQLAKEITNIIKNGLNDPRLFDQVFTITSVNTTKDLSHAKVRISFMDHENADVYVDILNKATSYIRKLVFEKINVRNMPSLFFEVDKGIEYTNEIEMILKKINEEKNNSNVWKSN